MSPAKKRSLLLALAALPLLGLLVWTLTCARPVVRIGADWTAADLHAALTAVGLEYEGREVFLDQGQPGYYLRRPDSPVPWAQLLGHARNDPARTLPGCVIVERHPFGLMHSGIAVGRVRVGHFLLIGDPVELSRIRTALDR